MFCSKCGANLPEGSLFCPKCGQAASATANTTVAAPSAVPVSCSNCGAELPDGSLFCLKCGQAVNAAANSTAAATEAAKAARKAEARARKPARYPKPRIAIWFVVLVLLLVAWWVSFAAIPHTETITETPFSVNSHSFSSFRFTVPPGATNVVVSGQFSATGGSANDVEVFVLTDDAFAAWQGGYSTNMYYDSGRVTQSSINAALPPGAGTYYLVFNNKFSLRTAKAVEAVATLRYSRWWPDFLLHLKEKLWSGLWSF